MITVVKDIEAAIIAKLEEDIQDLPVKGFPDRPEDFKTLPFKKGLVLVAYRGSRFSTPTNTDKIIQERTLEFSITIQIRNLRDHSGAYASLEAVRASLTGFSPLENKRVMHLSGEDFLDFSKNVWTWGQTWHLPARQA